MERGAPARGEQQLLEGGSNTSPSKAGATEASCCTRGGADSLKRLRFQDPRTQHLPKFEAEPAQLEYIHQFPPPYLQGSSNTYSVLLLREYGNHGKGPHLWHRNKGKSSG